ncbi:YHYH domain-containing protein [Pseudomonas sp. ER28]|uniref:YHYH domain-containing protein n=1 Tax=unclassified Pseudomonas TaxID=196821 RepID=UPI0023DECF03|nr:YHYH domain-containing protein [Pseudomonas sp. ER28]MDF3172152.1 YHYH domain-containing protein [Pseudomonas sp. ER28]
MHFQCPQARSGTAPARLAESFSSVAAFAHSGGTDSKGCHTNHKTGERHCH